MQVGNIQPTISLERSLLLCTVGYLHSVKVSLYMPEKHLVGLGVGPTGYKESFRSITLLTRSDFCSWFIRVLVFLLTVLKIRSLHRVFYSVLRINLTFYLVLSHS